MSFKEVYSVLLKNKKESTDLLFEFLLRSKKILEFVIV